MAGYPSIEFVVPNVSAMNPTAAPENVPSMDSVLPCQIQLPEGSEDFFERLGPLPAAFAERRRFPRFFYRRRAMMQYQDGLHCVYLKDICQDGLGFIHAAQVFPLDEVRLWLPDVGDDHAANGVAYSIVRCRRVGNAYYECGARLIEDDDGREIVDAVLKRLIWETGA